MLSKYLLTAVAAAGASQAAAITWNKGYSFGSETVRGVNIGGWLLLEPWITPSIFDNIDDPTVVDEYTLTEKVSNAADILTNHWDTWATQDDFAKIAAAGINTVRIGIGYWAFKKFDDEPYITGAADYLEKAVGWAEDLGLWVWVDLHGAPQSQNGYDNSGEKTSDPTWGTGDTLAQTEEVLQIIANKYATAAYSNVIAGIELVNEPALYNLTLSQDGLAGYYESGYNIVRDVTNTADTAVIMHDGFLAPSEWNGVLSTSDNDAQNVVVDHHEYQAFSDEFVAMSLSDHLTQVCTSAGTWAAGKDKWVVVGEWSAAMTDCAQWLNGYDVGARYDGTYTDSSYVGSCDVYRDASSWDSTLKANTRQYIEAQLDVFEQNSRGWVFWNFKTEDNSSPEWDFLWLVDQGVFPQPLTDRSSTYLCSVA